MSVLSVYGEGLVSRRAIRVGNPIELYPIQRLLTRSKGSLDQILLGLSEGCLELRHGDCSVEGNAVEDKEGCTSDA